MKRVVVAEPRPEETQRDGDGSSTLQNPLNDGNGKGRGSREATGEVGFRMSLVIQGIGNPKMLDQVEGDNGQPSERDVHVAREIPPQTWVSNVTVVGTENPENVGHHGDERHVAPSQRVEGPMPSDQGVGNVVNPLWSPERKHEALREAYGPGYDGNQDLRNLGSVLEFESYIATWLWGVCWNWSHRTL